MNSANNMNTDTRSPIGLKNDAEMNRCVNDSKTTEMSNKKVTETVFERAWVIPDWSTTDCKNLESTIYMVASLPR